MPLVRIEILKGKDSGYKKKLLDLVKKEAEKTSRELAKKYGYDTEQYKNIKIPFILPARFL